MGCEDKALIQKNDDLKVEISELEKELDTLKIEAGEDPGDQSAKLESANTSLASELEKLKALDEQVEKLEAERIKLEEEMLAYKKQYKIKE